MDCLSENVVVALIAGSLPAGELAIAERHLDRCAVCRALIAQAMRATPGERRIGRYRVRRAVGAGSMGRVYAAEDPDLGREVALKVLRAADGDDGHRDRLAREARAMARLAHPNVITVYEVATAGEDLFIAMELVHGATLGDWLRAAPRDWRAVADVLCAAGAGLDAAHAAGVIHRDFKPDNVLVGDDGRVRVTDFGLAQLGAVVGVPGELARAPALGLTVNGALVGTPAYMAPEQLRGGTVDERSDLFSFCVAFWEALYDARPFEGRDLDELRARVADGAIRPPADDRGVPRALRDAIRAGLAPAPDDRPASMAELLAAIEAAVASAPRAGVRVHRRRAVLGAAAALIAGALAIALAPRDHVADHLAPPSICAQPDDLAAPPTAETAAQRSLCAPPGSLPAPTFLFEPPTLAPSTDDDRSTRNR